MRHDGIDRIEQEKTTTFNNDGSRAHNTATSQIMGGVVCGIGMALHEETLLDHKFGRIMNANIAGYNVPVNADVHDIDVIFVDEPDALP